MKVAHINAGNEIGGGLVHIVSLLESLKEEDIDLIVLEEGPVAKAARDSGVRVYVFEQKYRFDLSVLHRLRTFIQKQDYTLLHTHGPRANSLIALLNPFLNVKWVMTIHSHPLLDFKDRGLKGRAFEAVHRRTFKKADGIIAVSSEIKTFLHSQGVSDSRIKVIHNGIRFSKSLKTLRSAASDRFTLVTVGRLTKVKGYVILMKALSELDRKDWQWLICGDGEEMAELKKKSKEYDLLHQLDFKGWLSASEIRQQLRQADLFVLPSLSETFPLVLLEAADEGVPAIATDVGDVRAVIKDSSMGWLIPPNNAESLRSALTEAYALWKTSELSDKGKKLRSHAVQFSIEEQAHSVQFFYQEVTAKNRK